MTRPVTASQRDLGRVVVAVHHPPHHVRHRRAAEVDVVVASETDVEAVLEALGQALHAEASFAVASVDVPTLGSRRIAVAQIVLVTNQTERLMIGSAAVDDDESRAVVRAVLDALNRVVPDLRR